MKINDKARSALQKADTQAIPLEMTPERREKFQRTTHKIVELLRAESDGPLEAYMMLQFVMDAFEESYGIRGSFCIEHTDKD